MESVTNAVPSIAQRETRLCAKGRGKSGRIQKKILFPRIHERIKNLSVNFIDRQIFVISIFYAFFSADFRAW